MKNLGFMNDDKSIINKKYADEHYAPKDHTHEVDPSLFDLGTASSKDVPEEGNATADQVVLGNDTRLSDARPAIDVHEWAKSEDKPSYTIDEIEGIEELKNNSITSIYTGEVIQVDEPSDNPLLELRILGKAMQEGNPTPQNPINVTESGSPGVIIVTCEGTDASQSEHYIDTPGGALLGIPVRLRGNYIDSSEQRWICDEISRHDDGTSSYLRRIQKVVFDGVNNVCAWVNKSLVTDSGTLVQMNLGASATWSDSDLSVLEVISDKGKFFNFSGNASCVKYGLRRDAATGACIFYVGTDEGVDSIATANTWLQNNPITVYYAIKPIEGSLNDEQELELDNIYNFANLKSITTDSNCGIELRYHNDSYDSKYVMNIENNLNSHTKDTTIHIPSGGAPGQVVMKNSNGLIDWGDAATTLSIQEETVIETVTNTLLNKYEKSNYISSIGSYSQVVFGNGIFVMSTNVGKLYYSGDCLNWIEQTSLTISSTSYGLALSFGNSTFVAFDAYTGKSYYSTDGKNWTAGGTFTSYSSEFNIAFGNSRFVAVGSSAYVYYSTNNGQTWTAGTRTGTNTLYDIAYGNSRFVAVGASGHCRYSTDNGVNWTTGGNVGSTSYAVKSITYANGYFIAVNSNKEIYSSTNGSSWSKVIRFESSMTSEGTVFYDNNLCMVVSDKGYIITSTSPSGTSWSSALVASSVALYDIAYGNGKVVIIAADGYTYVSDFKKTYSFSNTTSEKAVKEVVEELYPKSKIITRTLKAGDMKITIPSSRITTNSILSFYTSIYGVTPIKVETKNNEVTLTFSSQSKDMEVGVSIDG